MTYLPLSAQLDHPLRFGATWNPTPRGREGIGDLGYGPEPRTTPVLDRQLAPSPAKTTPHWSSAAGRSRGRQQDAGAVSNCIEGRVTVQLGLNSTTR